MDIITLIFGLYKTACTKAYYILPVIPAALHIILLLLAIIETLVIAIRSYTSVEDDMRIAFWVVLY